MSGARITTLAKGTTVAILSQKEGWYEIDLDSQRGWIASAYVTLDPVSPAAPAGVEFAPFDGPLAQRPRDRRECNRMFGDPTRGGAYVNDADPSWRAHHIIELHGDEAFLPVLAKSYFPIHHDIEPYAREAFRRAESAVPGYIQRPGTWGYNFRHMRHDPKMPLSYHSWGIAIDVNPATNSAVSFGADKYPAPWCPEWNKRWPKGVPQAIVLAFESCGFRWGGRWTDYCDPMHFEWLGDGGDV
jgi:hypothetical protein